MEEGYIGKWYKKEGDKVEKGERICEIDTEKSVDEVEAPQSGIIRKIMVPSGSSAQVNEIIAAITEPNESLPEEHVPIEKVIPTPEPNEGVKIRKQKVIGMREERIEFSPMAKKLAQEHGISLKEIRGTEPNGRMEKEDVLEATERVERAEVTPLTQMRKVIANRLSYSLKTALHVPLTIEVDMTEVVKLVRKIRPEIEKTHNIRLPYTSILIKAVAKALERHPILNSRFENGQIKILNDINIGVATAVEEGLVVPVVFSANTKSVVKIAKTLKAFVETSRQKILSSKEASGGTFTVSNLGMFGIDFFAPIINPPESAILGVGKIGKKPVVINNKITVRSMMTLTLVFDHRVMDGAVAARFLQTVKEIIEKPQNSVLDLT
jgi:pyruvate dehydrogenase E2 component (dihydrolipoamide acetyltransferase)